MKVEFIYHNFEKLIPTGASNAISVSELSQLTGMSTRSIRATVSRIRRQGKVICSNSDTSSGRTGFYFPASDEEVVEYVKNERLKLRTYHAAIRAAEKYIKERGIAITK